MPTYNCTRTSPMLLFFTLFLFPFFLLGRCLPLFFFFFWQACPVIFFFLFRWCDFFIFYLFLFFMDVILKINKFRWLIFFGCLSLFFFNWVSFFNKGICVNLYKLTFPSLNFSTPNQIKMREIKIFSIFPLFHPLTIFYPLTFLSLKSNGP